MNEDIDKKWIEEEYSWGLIYRLKQEYKNKDNHFEYLLNYWFIGSWKDGRKEVKYKEDLNKKKYKDFFIKYWEFKVSSKKEHKPKKQKESIEYNFILEGKIKGSVANTREIILQTGDFIIINPGNCINLQEDILEDTRGITIKSPGMKDDEEYCAK